MLVKNIIMILMKTSSFKIEQNVEYLGFTLTNMNCTLF